MNWICGVSGSNYGEFASKNFVPGFSGVPQFSVPLSEERGSAKKAWTPGYDECPEMRVKIHAHPPKNSCTTPKIIHGHHVSKMYVPPCK